MSSITIVFRKDKMNKNGEAPIHFRIIKHRKVSYISSGIKLSEEYWDKKNNRIKSKFTNSKRLNSYITTKFAELQNQFYENETISKTLTSRQLKEKIYGKKPLDFIEFAKKSNKAYLENNQIGTYNKNCSIIKKLSDYMNGKPLHFQELDFDFLTNYQSHLKTVLKNASSTVNKDFKFIRKLFNDAYVQDIIEHKDNPFNKFKLKIDKSERTYLTPEQLSQVEKAKLPDFKKIELHRDMFLFASYAGGIRISDLLCLKWTHFNGSHIYIYTKKSKQQHEIKVPNYGLKIIKKYKLEKPDKNAFIFPMLDPLVDLDDPIQKHNAISKATAYVNKSLKIIATKADLQKNLCFHVSRHTFGTAARRLGIPIDKISKIMTHSNQRDTEIYAKMLDQELDNAMDLFNKKKKK
jgi:integrase/recombinase XerD